MAPIIIAAVAVGAAIVAALAAGSAQASSAFESQVTDAVARNDAAALEKLANYADSQGWHDIAKNLRDEALKLRGEKKLVIGPTGPKPQAPTPPRGVIPPGLPVKAGTPAPMPALPAPIVLPPIIVDGSPRPAGVTEAPQRAAAQALTDYLMSIGGLSGRWHENRALVKTNQGLLGIVNPDGLYGSGTAKAIINAGLIPVSPYYWPSNAADARARKNSLLAIVDASAAGDPQNAPAWAKLRADIIRS